MRICAAQLKPTAGDIEQNLLMHIELINLAVANKVDLIFFPELSLTGYEPKLADELATTLDDSRLDVLQVLSDSNNITICVGMPIKDEAGSLISMVVFQPDQLRRLYSKQILHEDELPFFISGKEQLLIENKGIILAPAICFESLQLSHIKNAHELGANVYLASVAKSQSGVEKAYKHYPQIAKQYSMMVLMANCHGACDNFVSTGQSAVWNSTGECVGMMDRETNGLIGMDTDTGEVLLLTIQN